MKLVKKSLLALATAAAMATPAFAAVTAQGIVWEPGAVNAQFNFRQQIVAGELKGLGEFYQWGGSFDNPNSGTGGAVSGFAPGRELTVEFGGFNVTNLAAVLLGAAPIFSNGWLNIYSDNANDYASGNSTSYGAANNSDYANPFLQLAAVSNTFLSSGTGAVSGQLTVFWDVIGGDAASFFNTDTFSLNSDVTSRASATFANIVVANTGGFSNVGANGQVDLYSVPEPGSLALLGLGLIGLAAARRRKAA